MHRYNMYSLLQVMTSKMFAGKDFSVWRETLVLRASMAGAVTAVQSEHMTTRANVVCRVAGIPTDQDLMWLWLIGAAILYCIVLRKLIWRNTYLGGIDATFASADANGLRTTIHCVFTLDTNVTADTFRDLLITKYLVHRRLKQRLVHRLLLWHYWQDVSESDFKLSNHFIVHETLPGGGGGGSGSGQSQLEEYVSNQLTTPLHRMLCSAAPSSALHSTALIC